MIVIFAGWPFRTACVWLTGYAFRMIVCSCNVVTSQEIDAAVEELVASDGDVVLTPGMVYRTIGVRPKCGTCLRHVAKLIHAHRESLQGVEYVRSDMDSAPETV